MATKSKNKIPYKKFVKSIQNAFEHVTGDTVTKYDAADILDVMLDDLDIENIVDYDEEPDDEEESDDEERD